MTFAGWEEEEGAAVIGVKAVFQAEAGDAVDRSSYTFSNVPIGPASSDRFVIVAVMFSGSGANRTISSCSIGGTNGTNLVGAGVQEVTYFFGRNIASGTTANIVVTGSGTMARCAIVVWSLTGLNSLTPVGSYTQSLPSNENFPVTLPIAAGGVILAVALYPSASSPLWSGANQVSDAVYESRYAGAQRAVMPSGAANTLALNLSPAGAARLAAISLR